MELSKKTFSGEQLQVLKSLSPKIATLAGTAESKELRAEDIFKSEKKGKSANQKFYLFIGILLFDRQPLILKQKFNWKIRTNLTTKDELESILKEAGVKDTKAVFERAKKHYEAKEKANTAPKAPPVQKGKTEHASTSSRLPRGMRARETRRRGNANYYSNENNIHPNWNREPTEEEKRYTAKVAEKLRREQAEQNAWHKNFVRESAAAWAKHFPGKRYPPEDPGWQWSHSAKEWQYFPASASNPFYNDEFGFGRKYAAPPPSAAPQPPRQPSKAKLSCKEFLKEKGILVEGDTPKETKKKFLRWAIENHPDKGGDTAIFQEVSDCYDREIKPLLPHGGGRRTRKQRRT